MHDTNPPSQNGAETDEETASQTTAELRTSGHSEPMNEEQSMLTRRNALLTIAAGTMTTLAGCSDTSPGGNSTRDNGSNGQVDGNAINNLEINGYDLVVSLNTSAETNRVRLVDQEDSELSSTSVGAGVGQVSLSYEGYEPGEYSVLAVGGGNVIDEETITFDPEIEITDVGTVSQETPEFNRVPDKDHIQYDRYVRNYNQVWVSIENTGNVPVTVTNVKFASDGWEDDDPPHTEPADQSGDNLAVHGVLGIGGSGDENQTKIDKGGSYNALSHPNSPAFPGKTECSGTTGMMKITVNLKHGSNLSGEFAYSRGTKQGDWQDDVMWEKNKECPTSFGEIDPVSSG